MPALVTGLRLLTNMAACDTTVAVTWAAIETGPLVATLLKLASQAKHQQARQALSSLLYNAAVLFLRHHQGHSHTVATAATPKLAKGVLSAISAMLACERSYSSATAKGSKKAASDVAAFRCLVAAGTVLTSSEHAKSLAEAVGMPASLEALLGPQGCAAVAGGGSAGGSSSSGAGGGAGATTATGVAAVDEVATQRVVECVSQLCHAFGLQVKPPAASADVGEHDAVDDEFY